MNHGWTYHDRLLPAERGLTVLAYYLRRQNHSSAAEWRARCVAGQVTRNGRRVAADETLEVGDRLAWSRPPWEEPAVPRAFTILYEDDDLLAVDKPAGLPVLPGGGYVENTLLHLLQSRRPDLPPVPVHRLGRGTSGVLLLACSALARRQLAADFRDTTRRSAGVLRKIYRALTGPAPDLPEALEIAQPIGPMVHPALGWVHAASPTGKAACSHCRVLRRTPDDTLWEIDLITGRPHQIRIHLAWAGAPLLGDPLYAPGGLPRGPAEGRPPLPGDGGYWLHACALTFTHPRSGASLTLAAPPPAALAGADQPG
jgi:23S rRNA pseudouridine1911/1915/1917 synthase